LFQQRNETNLETNGNESGKNLEFPKLSKTVKLGSIMFGVGNLKLFGCNYIFFEFKYNFAPCFSLAITITRNSGL